MERRKGWTLTGREKTKVPRVRDVDLAAGRRRRGGWLNWEREGSSGSEGKVAQSCPTLCSPMGCTVHGILQARILEWVAVLFSRRSSQPRDRIQVSRIAGGFFTI